MRSLHIPSIHSKESPVGASHNLPPWNHPYLLLSISHQYILYPTGIVIIHHKSFSKIKITIFKNYHKLFRRCISVQNPPNPSLPPHNIQISISLTHSLIAGCSFSFLHILSSHYFSNLYLHSQPNPTSNTNSKDNPLLLPTSHYYIPTRSGTLMLL